MTDAGADQGVGASPSAGAEGISPTGRENCEPSHPASFSASSSRLRGTGTGLGGAAAPWGPRGRWPQVRCALGSSAGSLQGGLGAGDWSCCTEAPSPGWKPTGCWETTPGARLRKGSWGLLRGTPQPKRWVRVGGSMSPSQMRQRLPGQGKVPIILCALLKGGGGSGEGALRASSLVPPKSAEMVSGCIQGHPPFPPGCWRRGNETLCHWIPQSFQ